MYRASRNVRTSMRTGSLPSLPDGIGLAMRILLGLSGQLTANRRPHGRFYRLLSLRSTVVAGPRFEQPPVVRDEVLVLVCGERRLHRPDEHVVELGRREPLVGDRVEL